MFNKATKNIFPLLFTVLALSFSCSAMSKESSAELSLDQLYKEIKEERVQQKKEDTERERAFKQRKHEQKEKLLALKAELSKKQNQLENLKQNISNTDRKLEETKNHLNEQSHALKDLFSVWKQAVKDGKANAQASISFHQFPAKLTQLEKMSAQSSLPDGKDLRAIFELLQHDIQEGRQSALYQAEVIDQNGQGTQKAIQRIGTFSNTSEGKFLIHNPDKNTLISLPVQPNSDILETINSPHYQNLTEGSTIDAVIDPSRGLVLEQLALIPSWEERFHQGGYIGYAIITLGALGLLLSIFRWLTISYSQLAIKRQMKSPTAIDTRNPLGKILAAYQESLTHIQNDRRKVDKVETETLEVQLQEIVLAEMPKLDRGLGTIKLLAAIAPLMGLLGTVVGMINTFQSITLVGNADPKLMADGISQALMTTVMGLLVAVPLLFSHNLLAAKTKKVIMFLTQQSLGFIVKYMQTADSPQASSTPQSSNSEK